MVRAGGCPGRPPLPLAGRSSNVALSEAVASNQAVAWADLAEVCARGRGGSGATNQLMDAPGRCSAVAYGARRS